MKQVFIMGNSGAGLIHFRKELVECLVKQGYEVYVSLPVGKYTELIKQLGCVFIETPVDRRGTNPINDLKLIIHYYHQVKNVDPDVVLTYTIKPNTYGALVSRFLKIPYVVNITGTGSVFNNDGLIKKMMIRLLRISLRRAACVFFQNETNRQYFLDNRMVISRNRLIPGSGVNLSNHCLEEYPADGTINFLFIGRVMKEKGIDEYLTAAEIIKSRYPFAAFSIIGSFEEAYSETLSALQEKDVITFYGFQSDVHSFIKSCHAVIQPSYHEGMSNVLLEAASCGRPVIASAIPGCQEAFEEGISGYGFEPRNAEALIDVIEKFIKLPHIDKQRMGLAGRAKMEREFDRQTVVNSYMEEIKRITDQQ